MVTLNLDKIFDPKSIAIIGASDVEGSVGLSIVKNLTKQGYAGKVYLVNIRKPEILGVKTYPTVLEIPEVVDLAMIATPAKTVPDVMEECGRGRSQRRDHHFRGFQGNRSRGQSAGTDDP